MSLLDRAIEVVAPEWGLRRAVARTRTQILNANGYGYGKHGASTSKRSLAGWTTWTGGPDLDITENLDVLRERSRDLCMGEPLAIGALRTIRLNEVGAGLRLNAQIDAAALGLTDEQAHEWEDLVEREFCLWADSKACDASRRCTFGELQALARLSQLVSGDVFALLPALERDGERYELHVWLLEADRVCNPNVYPAGKDILGGVEVGRYGEPVAFWVASDHPGDTMVRRSGHLLPLRSWERIPAFGPATGRPFVLHLMDAERPGQRRGVPALAPVVERFKQLSRYSDAEIMAAVLSGFLTVAVTSETPQSPFGLSIPTTQQVETQNAANEIQLGNGAVIGLAPGEKLQEINPARPNAQFEPFVVAILKQIAAGLPGMTLGLLTKTFNASYSASRAELLEAWKAFTVGRQLLAQNFCQPVYEQWLEEAVARGYVEAPGFFDDPLKRAAWCGAEWSGPAQGQLDPTKEVEAAAKRVAEGFSTRTKETRELTGGDWWSFNRLRAREEAARKSDGLVRDDAPQTDGQRADATLTLTATDLATIASVDEGRASVGLPPAGGDVGQRWIVEHAAKIKAESAPDIAEAAAAEQGRQPGSAPAQSSAPASSPPATADDDEPDEDDESEEDAA